MTEEERAGVVLMLAKKRDIIFVSEQALCEAVAFQIREAIAEEREACAKVAEGDADRDDYPWCGDVRDIAAAIRSRGVTS